MMAAHTFGPTTLSLSKGLAPLVVTGHAIMRYQQRVANLPETLVIAALTTPAIQRAASFGAEYVRLGTGHRLVIRQGRVITVKPGHDLNPHVHRDRQERRTR